MKYKRLNLSDRIRIEAGLNARKPIGMIAREIGRHPSTVIREIRSHRIIVPGNRYACKDCTYSYYCVKTDLCEKQCGMECHFCKEIDCRTLCANFHSFSCEKTAHAPYTCVRCDPAVRRRCNKDKAYYFAEKADRHARTERSRSRKHFHATREELEKIDGIISPLIRKGQPLHHICAVHSKDIGISERTVYRYIDAKLLKVTNLDLRRKVRYRRRKNDEPKPKRNFQYREGRNYEDFQRFTASYDDMPVVQMDTVKGRQNEKKCMLTLLLLRESVMLIFRLSTCSQNAVLKVFDMLTDKLGTETFRRLFPVILTDNGSEFKDPISIEFTGEGEPRTRMFYCDPQASWQKAELEKNHEYIRYVLPKGVSIKPYNQEDFTLLANHINSVRRKGLKNRSPYEMVSGKDMEKLLDLLGMSPIPADDINLTKKLLSR